MKAGKGGKGGEVGPSHPFTTFTAPCWAGWLRKLSRAPRKIRNAATLECSQGAARFDTATAIRNASRLARIGF
jgi:hypothetical protein